MELETPLSALIDGAAAADAPWSSGPLKKPDFKRDKQLRSKYDHYPIREPSAPDEYKASVGYKERWFVLNPEGGGTLDYYRAKARSRAPSRKRVRLTSSAPPPSLLPLGRPRARGPSQPARRAQDVPLAPARRARARCRPRHREPGPSRFAASIARCVPSGHLLGQASQPRRSI